MKVGCPTCGAEVEFRYDDSFVRICGSCHSAVLRSDRGIETLGKLADLVPIDSPLRLFAEGKYRSVSFLLVGMAQIRHAAGGIWQEWYAKLDGGQWAWLSEAQGRYYLTFERSGTQIPPYAQIRPGLQLPINDRLFTVGEVGAATYASAAGEIPYRLEPQAQLWFADLSDGQGGFATIDYNDGSEPPTLYVGHQVALPELALFGGEALGTAAPRIAQGKQLACPNCGGSLELRAPDQTQRIGCPYCAHLISVQQGDLRVLGKLAGKPKLAIPLGSVGRFVDGELTVIGYMQRSAQIGSTWYPFDEYLLHAPAVGFRWLVCSDGHWSYVQPIAPGAVEVSPLRYDGVSFATYQRAPLRVDVVVGEFYWQVAAGELVVAEDAIAPPAMLSSETSKTEQSWSLSSYLAPRAVQAAFAREGREPLVLPPPVGVAPNQPYPLHGAVRVGVISLALLAVAGVVSAATTANVKRHDETFQIENRNKQAILPTAQPLAPLPGSDPAQVEAPPGVAFSRPFQLEAGQNIAIEMTAPLVDAWLYAAVDLVNEDTGSVVTFDANLEYYSGTTDGESWSEGSQYARQVLAAMDAGRYVLRVEGTHDGAMPVPFSVSVRQDVFRGAYWLYAAGFLALPLLLLALHGWSFKKKRWENSSIHNPALTGEPADDDDSSWGSDDD